MVHQLDPKPIQAYALYHKMCPFCTIDYFWYPSSTTGIAGLSLAVYYTQYKDYHSRVNRYPGGFNRYEKVLRGPFCPLCYHPSFNDSKWQCSSCLTLNDMDLHTPMDEWACPVCCQDGATPATLAALLYDLDPWPVRQTISMDDIAF